MNKQFILESFLNGLYIKIKSIKKNIINSKKDNCASPRWKEYLLNKQNEENFNSMKKRFETIF